MTIETGELVRESSATLTVAKGFKIVTAEEYTKAAPILAGIKALQKKIDDTFDPHIKRAFEAHRSLVAEKKSHLAPLAEQHDLGLHLLQREPVWLADVAVIVTGVNDVVDQVPSHHAVAARESLAAAKK